MEILPITTFTFETSYGKIFARSVGLRDHPLFLIVHGSGSDNGSHWYENFLFEYYCRYSQIFPLFIVAIDCPGYGKSTGIKSAIRAFPTQFITEVSTVLKKEKSLFMLMGHSQGGYSVFNALHNNPNLARFLIQERPVCGDIKKFAGFSIPTLLVYDTEDDGHPIKQGFLLAKELKNYEFLSYNCKIEPYFIDNLMDSIIVFLYKYRSFMNPTETELYKNCFKGINFKEIVSRINNTTTINQIVKKKVDRNFSLENNEKSEISNIKKKLFQEDYKVNDNNEKNNDKDLKGEIFQKVVTKTNKQIKANKNDKLDKEEETKLKTANQFMKKDENNLLIVKNDQQHSSEDSDFNNKKLKKNSSLKNIKVSKSLKKIDEENTSVISKEEKVVNVVNINISEDDSTFKCALCYDFMWEPITTTCNHSFCYNCGEKAFIYHASCPMCRKEISTSEVNKLTDKRYIDTNLFDKIKNSMSQDQLLERQKQAKKDELSKSKYIRVEYGNLSEPVGIKPSISKTNVSQKYKMTVFAKVYSSPVNNPIKSVEFDINIGNKTAKPIIVTKSPFEFEKSLSFQFPVEFKINWADSLKLKPYVITHSIQLGPPKTSRNFIQELNK